MRSLPIIYIIITITLCPAKGLLAQAINTDSLTKVISGNAGDAEKIKAYKALSKNLITKNFDECIEISFAGIKLASKNNDIASAGELTDNIGVSYYLKGDYDSAATYYYKALELDGKANNQLGRASVLNDIGRLYRKTRNLDRALQNYDEAYEIYRRLNDEDGMATILNESGVVFEYKEDYNEAISRYKRSLAIREKMNDLLGRSYSLNFIGGAFTQMKNYAAAEKYLLESMEIRKQLKDTFTLALSYSDLAAMYALKGDYDKAIEGYKRSDSIAIQMGYPQLLIENYGALADIEEKKGNSILSLDYYKKRTALKDSILNEDKIKQIETLNAKYQAEKKEQQLKVQQFEIQRKNYLVWSLIAILALLVFSGFSLYRRRQVQESLRLQQAVLYERDTATKAVMAAEEDERKRIAADLHDGVGQMMSAAKMNLSVFENEIPFKDDQQKQSFEKVIGLIDESCKEIRSVSHQMMPNALLKRGLADAVKEFIDKIDQRIIKVSLHTEGLNERIDNTTETVLYRVIQECVNNVLKHSKATQLDICLIKDKDGIAATIEDNGMGFDSSGRHSFEGIGLKNIISRVNYLKGSIDFDSSPGKGTLVAIHIPVEKH